MPRFRDASKQLWSNAALSLVRLPANQPDRDAAAVIPVPFDKKWFYYYPAMKTLDVKTSWPRCSLAHDEKLTQRWKAGTGWMD
jgi:hypothetical protein